MKSVLLLRQNLYLLAHFIREQLLSFQNYEDLCDQSLSRPDVCRRDYPDSFRATALGNCFTVAIRFSRCPTTADPSSRFPLGPPALVPQTNILSPGGEISRFALRTGCRPGGSAFDDRSGRQRAGRQFCLRQDVDCENERRIPERTNHSLRKSIVRRDPIHPRDLFRRVDWASFPGGSDRAGSLAARSRRAGTGLLQQVRESPLRQVHHRAARGWRGGVVHRLPRDGDTYEWWFYLSTAHPFARLYRREGPHIVGPWFRHLVRGWPMGTFRGDISWEGGRKRPCYSGVVPAIGSLRLGGYLCLPGWSRWTCPQERGGVVTSCGGVRAV